MELPDHELDQRKNNKKCFSRSKKLVTEGSSSLGFFSRLARALAKSVTFFMSIVIFLLPGLWRASANCLRRLKKKIMIIRIIKT